MLQVVASIKFSLCPNCTECPLKESCWTDFGLIPLQILFVLDKETNVIIARSNVCLTHAPYCSAAAVMVCMQEPCAKAGAQQINGMSSTQHPPQLNFGPRALNDTGNQHAEHAVAQHLSAGQHISHAEVQRLTHAVAESEQRAAAAELAVAAVQKACHEAVERSTRLQVVVRCIPFPCELYFCEEQRQARLVGRAGSEGFGVRGQVGVRGQAKVRGWIGCPNAVPAV